MQYRIVFPVMIFLWSLMLSTMSGAMAPRLNVPVIFPKDFKWCVATSAHQIEGGNENSDWWDWEQTPGHIKNGDRSGRAPGHWDHLDEDVRLLQDLHVGQYRFSVEWAKIEPQPGVWNWDAVAHYKTELALLRSAGVEPMVTLHHFTLPRWFAAQGGWENAAAPELFARYATFVMTNIGPEVHDWITINEPMVHLVQGYMSGFFPPGRKGGFKTVMPPMIGLLHAHAAAYHAMHAIAATPGHVAIRIGIAHHLRVFDPPHGLHPLDSFLAGKFDHAFNWAFINAIETGKLKLWIPFAIRVNMRLPDVAHTQDFIGVNYYGRDIVSLKFDAVGFSLSVEKNSGLSDLGWEIYPHGFYRILKAVAKRYPDKKIFITENGIADAKDAKRAKFLEDHLREMARAMREGVQVEGYCHWSLLDNFEWGEGFAPRFGLYEVDYTTLARKARPSARRFGEIATQNAL